MAGSLKPRLAVSIAVLAGLVILFEISRLQDFLRAVQTIEALRADRAPADTIGVEAPLEVQLARAGFLARSDRLDDAQELLAYLSERGTPSARELALFNLGNLYLRRALAKTESGETDQAIPLVILAKESYRKALALEPAHWDAKFNLEFATRMLPERQRSGSAPDVPDEEGTNRLWTTLPGLPRGQP